jgi:hypothetical protein
VARASVTVRDDMTDVYSDVQNERLTATSAAVRTTTGAATVPMTAESGRIQP